MSGLPLSACIICPLCKQVVGMEYNGHYLLIQSHRIIKNFDTCEASGKTLAAAQAKEVEIHAGQRSKLLHRNAQ